MNDHTSEILLELHGDTLYKTISEDATRYFIKDSSDNIIEITGLYETDQEYVDYFSE